MGGNIEGETEEMAKKTKEGGEEGERYKPEKKKGSNTHSGEKKEAGKGTKMGEGSAWLLVF